MKNIKTHKATGPDSIPAFILKAAAADELAPALAVLSLSSKKETSTKLPATLFLSLPSHVSC